MVHHEELISPLRKSKGDVIRDEIFIQEKSIIVKPQARVNEKFFGLEKKY